MTALFLSFVAIMALAVLALWARYLGRQMAVLVAAGLALWFLYVGGLGYMGVFANSSLRPPGAAFLFGPVLTLVLLLIWRLQTVAGGRVATAFPLWVLLGVQAFRVIVELFLHALWQAGLIPQMLTFAGSNVDIYLGASAPLVAWWATRSVGGRRMAVRWNVLGLLALANVVVRAVLTAPGPLQFIHTERPDLMIGTFPFMFIPGFFVPLAVLLHFTALRSLRAQRW